MNSQRKESRRQALRSLGAGLAGIFVAVFARKAQSGVFASVALQDSHPLPVPAGHYDEATQLYVDSRTGAPMFASPSEQRHRVLSAEELDNLAQTLDVRDASRKIQVAQRCTISRQTSYSTTSCCPIVTDSKNDQDCDDTPEKDKDWK